MNPAALGLLILGSVGVGVAIGYFARCAEPCSQWLAGYAEGYRAGRSEVTQADEAELH